MFDVLARTVRVDDFVIFKWSIVCVPEVPRVMYQFVALTVLVLRSVAGLRRDDPYCEFTVDGLYYVVVVFDERHGMLVAVFCEVPSWVILCLVVANFQLDVLVTIVVSVSG